MFAQLPLSAWHRYVSRTLLLAIGCLLTGLSQVSGQSTVKGSVSDLKNKENLPGVSILLKGTQRGTNTDANGSFEIADVPAGGVLIFSYIGYKKTEVSVNGKTSLSVSMEEDANNLEETVVIGFGTQKKINIAGAVDQIAGKQLEARPIANVMQGLQGISPGLNITYGGGAPGTVPEINIRGFTSINGGAPLIVIDGIAASDGFDMLRLNPADIASFTVLKDAASAAIYGARAAFGVILITTKQGGAGQQTISYNTYFSWGRPTVLPKPVTDPYIFQEYLKPLQTIRPGTMLIIRTNIMPGPNNGPMTRPCPIPVLTHQTQQNGPTWE